MGLLALILVQVTSFLSERKEDMLTAFRRVKELGGGMVVAENNEVLHEIALPLLGIMSNLK